MTTGEDKGKHLEEGEWVHKVAKKEVGFDFEHAKETFMEANKNFVEASTLGSHDKQSKEMDPCMLTIFLDTYMKMPCNSKAVKGL